MGARADNCREWHRHDHRESSEQTLQSDAAVVEPNPGFVSSELHESEESCRAAPASPVVGSVVAADQADGVVGETSDEQSFSWVAHAVEVE